MASALSSSCTRICACHNVYPKLITVSEVLSTSWPEQLACLFTQFSTGIRMRNGDKLLGPLAMALTCQTGYTVLGNHVIRKLARYGDQRTLGHLGHHCGTATA